MARLFISSADGEYQAGRSQTDLVGTDGVEVVILEADSKTNFDASFNRGGDTIRIKGAAGLYTATLSGSNVVLTASNGANIVIPVGTAGMMVQFEGESEGRELVFADGAVSIGDQAINGQGVVLDDPGVTPPAGDFIDLSVGKDNLQGTGGSDTFRARIVQNASGEQTNELGSGDRLVGGAGNDLLSAFVQDASPLNAGPASSIAPETIGVETAHFTARSTATTIDDVELDEILRLFSGLTGESEFFGAGAQLGVEINAADMWGLEEVGSLNSDDSLTIYNLTTLTDSGNYAQRRLTEEVTIRMDHSGNGSLVEIESDLTVLFDQNYLLARGDVEAGAQLVIEIMDLDAAIAGRDPLEDNPFGEIDFLLGGTLYTLTFGTDANTYEELLEDVRFALSQNPAFAGLSADFGGTFVASDTDNDPGGSAEGRSIVIVNSGSETLEAVTMRAIGDAPAGKDFHTNFEALEGDTEGFLITSNIVLNKVGRGGDGGDLTVGGQNTDGANVYGFGTSPTQLTPVRSVEQFNITVEGDSTQPTDLASLQSTNNQLQVVNLVSEAGSTATFTLGNNNTGNVPLLGTTITDFFDDTFGGTNADLSTFRNLAMKDVLIFNATGFVNDTEVHAYFSDEVVEKYLNREDTQVDAALDNADALYSFGAADNVLNVNLSKSNFAVAGTETREDFSFTADMGAGDDTVQIQIGNGFNALSGESGADVDIDDMFAGSYLTEDGVQTVQNWYANHVINGDLTTPVANLSQNLVVNTGTGNDSVELWGATAADVNLGAGNDWVFTDNSGQIEGTSEQIGEDLPNNFPAAFNNGKATWVFNQRTADIDDLQSQTPVAINNVANLALRVSFQGIEATVDVGASAGSINGVTVSDLTINQAIKNAINSDPFLNKLLVAQDGPGRTLIVRSKIDGEHITTDLGITLLQSAVLSPAQIAGLATAINGTGSEALNLTPLGFTSTLVGTTLVGLPTAAVGRWESEFAFDDSYGTLAGIDSINVNNNNVEGDTGDDLIVLSSNGVGNGIGVNSSTIGNSTETIDINAAFGNDRILNFTAAGGETLRNEVQEISVSGTSVAAGTITITYDGEEIVVDVPAGATSTTVAGLIAAAIGGATGAGTAITVDGTTATVTVTNDEVGNIAEATVATAVTGGGAESSSIEFTGTPATGEVVQLTFAGVSYSVTVDAGQSLLSVVEELATEVRGDIAGESNVVVTPTGDPVTSVTLALTNDVGGNVPDAIILSTTGGLDAVVTTTTQGATFGVTLAVETTLEGSIPAQGYDIFDVTTVLSGAVSEVVNQVQVDGIEAGAIQFNVTNNVNNYVLITDTVEQDDYASFAGPLTTELARITEIVRDVDTAAQTSATDGIIITVNGTTNVGTFYYVVDGVAANDSTVTLLGSVELGTYNNAAKDAIGDWDLMNLANFTPLNVQGLEGTYDILG